MATPDNTKPANAGLVAMPSTTLPLKQRVRRSLALPVLIVIALVVGFGAINNHLFVAEATWTNILRSSSFTIIVACFEGLVMIAGGLDLSVGSTLLAGSMMAAYLSNSGQSTVVVVVLTVGVGAGIGLINGILTSWVKISPIIATLGTMFAVSSIVVTLSHGLAIGPLPDDFTKIANTSIGAIPGIFIYAIIIAAVVHVVLEYSTFGTKVRAIGGNRDGADKLGLNARRTSTIVYVLSGAFAALAGLLQASNLGAGDPSFGTGLELQVIAAAVIGGVSVYGSIGTIPGIVSGAILLSLITIALVLLQISGTLQDFVIGSVLILAVAIDRIRTVTMFRTSIKASKQPSPEQSGHTDPKLSPPTIG